MDVLVLGSANVDLVVAVSRRPRAGETVLGDDARVLPGGKGANTAVAAARLGARVAFAGAVGHDAYGDLLLTSLGDAGVRTELVRRVERPTGLALITVTPDGDNSIVVSPGANSAVADVPVEGARVLVCSLEIPVDAVERAAQLAAARGTRVVLNLSPVAPLSPETVRVLDPLVVNQHEAEELGDALHAARSAIVTLGADGVRVHHDGATTHVPAPRVTAVDTTGAGDAFAGSLAARLAAGDDLVTAARYAVAVASISVTRPGAQPSYPDAGEVARTNSSASSAP